jgi:hypothetical protein
MPGISVGETVGSNFELMSVFAEFERAMIRANRLAPMTLGNRLAVGVQRLFVSF